MLPPPTRGLAVGLTRGDAGTAPDGFGDVGVVAAALFPGRGFGVGGVGDREGGPDTAAAAAALAASPLRCLEKESNRGSPFTRDTGRKATVSRCTTSICKGEARVTGAVNATHVTPHPNLDEALPDDQSAVAAARRARISAGGPPSLCYGSGALALGRRGRRRCSRCNSDGLWREDRREGHCVEPEAGTARWPASQAAAATTNAAWRGGRQGWGRQSSGRVGGGAWCFQRRRWRRLRCRSGGRKRRWLCHYERGGNHTQGRGPCKHTAAAPSDVGAGRRWEGSGPTLQPNQQPCRRVPPEPEHKLTEERVAAAAAAGHGRIRGWAGHGGGSGDDEGALTRGSDAKVARAVGATAAASRDPGSGRRWESDQ